MSYRPQVDEAYPYEVREYAYQLWAFIANRNISRTARIMNGEEELPERVKASGMEPIDLTDRQINPNTISKWSKRGKWVERIQREMRSYAPEAWQQVMSTLVSASSEAADYLRQVVNDPGEDTKFRVDAAKTILDRAGHLPFNRPSDDSRPTGPSRDYSHAIAGLSDEEIAARLFQLPSGESAETDPAI